MSHKQDKIIVQNGDRSFKGASNLNVAQSEIKKSFNGAANLKPAPIQTQKPTSQPASPPSQKVDTGKNK